MKEKYIELMEKALSAYTDEHIEQYYSEVLENGLKEHGFPRLAANIGVLIAHGRRTDLLPMFIKMMDLCCESFPRVKAANDFSVREVVCCLLELEPTNIIDGEKLAYWKELLRTIKPETCYNVYAKTPEDPLFNWALFSGTSEYLRQYAGLCHSEEFIDMQIASQLKWLDENGMYRDAIKHPPAVYDNVSRYLFSMLLHFGYRGQYYDRIDAALDKAGKLSLLMQSVTGEIPFGGRSNQFVNNEGQLITILEFEASRYAGRGDMEMASRFKAGVKKALDRTEALLNETPISHIKNRFPWQEHYGCEGYGYFDKYMITVASHLFNSYLLCDDSIPAAEESSPKAYTFRTSPYFQKFFMRGGEYFAEFDLEANPKYDTSGLGRVHRKGAPSALCLSHPGAAHPHYNIGVESTVAFSLCPGVENKGQWVFATESADYEVVKQQASEDRAVACLACVIYDNEWGKKVRLDYEIDDNGVHITVSRKGTIAHMLPAFCFDGETQTEITHDEHCVTVSYRGWTCRYTTDGKMEDSGEIGRNRNGHYRLFRAVGQNILNVHIEIFKN